MNDADIGVIVGRFQVHELHEAHLNLINSVKTKHNKVLIMLGIAAPLVTKRNPLDFATRKQMIMEIFPDIIVAGIPDVKSDYLWSNTLDKRIKELFPIGKIMLYGSRDSFIDTYTGQFPTTELDSEILISGTEIRKNVSHEVRNSIDFRIGIIYAAFNQYDKVFPTVDVAIIKDNKLLLGKKLNEKGYRFIGGFVDPSDNSFEDAAKREVFEETGAIVEDDLVYVGNYKINDWRYRSETDKIITTLFIAKYFSGKIEPNDDINEIRFFEITSELKDKLEPEHAKLYEKFYSKFYLEHINSNK